LVGHGCPPLVIQHPERIHPDLPLPATGPTFTERSLHYHTLTVQPLPADVPEVSVPSTTPSPYAAVVGKFSERLRETE